MHLIKVSAIKSTNSFAREMFRENPGMSPTCIWAEKQLEGRGQRGSSWNSEAGRNLTFSVIYPAPAVAPARQFALSAAVATGIVEALEKYAIPKLMVKWPNDIMSANYKIGGLLIENVITDGRIAAVIIGLGLNVNQENFPGLPAAGSLRKATGREYDLNEVLEGILEKMEEKLNKVSDAAAEGILKEYKKKLFRMKIPSTFQLPDGSLFTGRIIDVSFSGKLIVETENDSFREYDLKEVKLCY